MKSYNEFVNEKFDYTKQKGRIINFDALNNGDTYYMLYVDAIGLHITTHTITNIKIGNFDEMDYKDGRDDVVAYYTNYPISIQVNPSYISGVSTSKELLEKFIKTPYFSKYKDMCSNDIGTPDMLMNLFKKFLKNL